MILANYAQQNRNTVREWGIGFTNPLAQFKAVLVPAFYTPAQPMGTGYAKSAFNPGYNTHYAWQHAYKPGGLSSHNAVRPAATFSGSGAMGVNGVASFAAVSSWEAVGQLVVSGVGSFAATATFAGNAIATLSAAGSFSAVAAFEAGITAKAWATGQFTPSYTGSGTLTATGSLIGSFPASQSETLTADQIAAAVMEAMNAAPPMVDVAKVNGLAVAGSGTEADPWGPE
jgi:hypothetical protein